MGGVTGNHGNSDSWVVKLAPDPLALADFKTKKVILYPNPVTDQLTITRDILLISAQVYDVSGKLVMIFAEIDSFFHTLEASQIPSGFYFLELETGPNVKMVKSFIKK